MWTFRSFEQYAPWTLCTLCLVIWAGDVVANGVVHSRQRVIAWWMHILHRVLAYIVQKDTSACIYYTECLRILYRMIQVLAYIVQSACLYCTERYKYLHILYRVLAFIAQRDTSACILHEVFAYIVRKDTSVWILLRVPTYSAQWVCLYCKERYKCLHILYKVFACSAQQDTSVCISYRVLAYIAQRVCIYQKDTSVCIHCIERYECLHILHSKIRVFAHIAHRKLGGCIYRIEKIWQNMKNNINNDITLYQNSASILTSTFSCIMLLSATKGLSIQASAIGRMREWKILYINQ